METKKPDLEVLFKNANAKTGEAFLKWLKKNRPKGIRGRHLKNPYYKNKGLVIESTSDLKVAGDLCERIVEFSRDIHYLSPDYVFAFRGILNRIRLEAFKFEKKHNFQFYTYEAFFLEKADEKEAAKFVLNILNDLDIPFNDNTSDLYEMLISLDSFYTGMDRLNQRRLLSLTYRDLDLPPFFANDNVFLISERKQKPVTSLTPREIEFSFGSNIPPHSNCNEIAEVRILKNWDFLLLDRKDKGFWIYDEKNKLIGPVTTNAAEVLKILLRPSNLLHGVCLKNHTAVLNTRKSGSKTTKGDTTKAYRKKIRDAFLTSENKHIEIIHHSDGISIINPNLKIILVTPSSVL